VHILLEAHKGNDLLHTQTDSEYWQFAAASGREFLSLVKDFEHCFGGDGQFIVGV